MLRNLILFSMIGLSLTSCSMITSLQRNREAIDYSTCVIYQNAEAIEIANSKIRENSQRLGEINKTLEKAGEK